MRIGMISSHPEGYGGVQTHVHFLSNQLVKMGHEVHVFATKKLHDRELNDIKYNIYEVPFSINYTNFWFNTFCFSKYIERKVREIGIDIIHSHFGLPYGLSIPKSCDKVLITCHGSGLVWKGWKKPLKLLTKKVLKRSNYIVCVSKHLQNVIFLEYKNISSEKIDVIYNGSTLNSYINDKYILREEYEYTKDDFIILYAGTLIKRKNPMILLKAFKKLINKKYDNLKLIFVGGGPLEKEIINYINNNGMNSQINMKGRVSDEELKKIFAMSDVFALPSPNEPFGIVFLEAMASGLPLIASKNAGISEVIENEKNGLLIRPNNIENLMLKIIEIKNKKNLREKIRKNNIAKIKNDFSWENIANEYCKIYKNL